MRITIKKGLDIPIAGAPEPVLEQGGKVRSVALLGDDYAGLRPRMKVEVGERVRLGQPLFVDKNDPLVAFTAPGSGTVAAINRGARRALQSVVINVDESGDESANESADEHAQLTRTDPATIDSDAVRSALLTTGLWTAFRTRPFNRVPQSDSTPRSIFVTAIDSRPLAGDPALVLAERADAFLHGLAIIGRLTDGAVFVCTGVDWSGPRADGEQFRQVEFAGPHPAGLPGTHIHYLDPAGAARTVWHIGYQDVIAIGTLFSEGRLSVERTVALGGEGFLRPRLVTTRLGAAIDDLVADELQQTGADPTSRLISGSVLSGRIATGAVAYLGRYHQQVSALPDIGERRLFGWLRGATRKTHHTRRRHFTTAQHGRLAALVPVHAFENVMPLDMLPVPLLRALLIKDTDQAQALGCLELDAEDLELCSYVCPGKNDYGDVLRANLEQIERDG